MDWATLECGNRGGISPIRTPAGLDGVSARYRRRRHSFPIPSNNLHPCGLANAWGKCGGRGYGLGDARMWQSRWYLSNSDPGVVPTAYTAPIHVVLGSRLQLIQQSTVLGRLAEVRHALFSTVYLLIGSKVCNTLILSTIICSCTIPSTTQHKLHQKSCNLRPPNYTNNLLKQTSTWGGTTGTISVACRPLGCNSPFASLTGLSTCLLSQATNYTGRASLHSMGIQITELASLLSLYEVAPWGGTG